MSHQPKLFPVSVKAVVIRDGRVLLLRNERDEWELPGGKLDLGEEPVDCVAREIVEEVGWKVNPGPLLDAWPYRIRDGVDVLVLTYGCHAATDCDPPLSREHRQVGMFSEAEVATLPMPDRYKETIAIWFARLSARVM